VSPSFLSLLLAARPTTRCRRPAGMCTIVKSTTGKFREGERIVASWWPGGTWTTYTTVEESSLVRLPMSGQERCCSAFRACHDALMVGMMRQHDTMDALNTVHGVDELF